MKAWGWILIVLGALNIIVCIIAAANGANAGGRLVCGIAFCVLGGYLLHRASQKEEEKHQQDNWSNE